MIDRIIYSLLDVRNVIGSILSDSDLLSEIESASKLLIETFNNDHRVFSCGNGGSMCNAMHFSEELTGRFRKDRRPYPAIAISDSSYLTCVANDYGYQNVFSRYLEAHGCYGDCLLAISTSNNNPAIMNAAMVAKHSGMNVISLTGNINSIIKDISNVHIYAPSNLYADRIQEIHITVVHILIEMVERHMNPENYEI